MAALSASVAIRMRAGRAGKRQDLLVPDDLLDLLEPGLIMGEDRVADELVFLECPDDVAIVGRRQPLVSGNLRGDGLHLALDLGEGQVSLGGELGRRNVDANLLEAKRIELRRQTKVLAGPGQDLGLDELIPGGELILELAIGRLVALDLELLEQLADAGDEKGGLGQVFLDLRLDGGNSLGLPSRSRIYDIASSVIGFVPGSRPAYLRSRTSAAGRRLAATWSSSRPRNDPNMSWSRLK